MFVPHPLSLRVRFGIRVTCWVLAALPVGLQAQVLPAEQEFIARRWDARNGLPGGGINAISQTSDGFLWLATKRGLARFDGTRFKTFDAESVAATNVVWCLLADREDGLWLGTQNGLLRLKAGRFETIDFVSHTNGIVALARDKEGSVWGAMTAGRVVRLNTGTNEIYPPPAANFTNVFLTTDAADELHLASSDALFRWREGGWQPEPEPPPGLKNIGAVCPRADGGLWIGTGRQIKKFKGQPVPAPFEPEPGNKDAPQSQITALLEDRSGRLWAGTRGGGVFCFAPEKGWRRVTPRRPRPQGAISALYEDADGALWVGTSMGGLHQIQRRLLTSWSLPVTAHDSIPQTVCVARDGNVWVGTDGAGAFRYRDGSFTRFGGEQGLTSVAVVAIFEDSRARLWFATLGGLFRLEGEVFHPVATTAVAGHVVTALFEDRSGDLWVGMDGAVARLRGETVKLFQLPDRFRNFEVRALAQTANGTLWIGTRGGGLFRVARERVERSTSFTRRAVLALYGDAEGALWVGTLNGGLFRLKDGINKRWSADDGLPGNTVYGFVEDDQGRLWMNSNDGVFGVGKQALVEYNRARGIPLSCLRLPLTDAVADEASSGSGQPAATKSADGRLWFPTARGMVSFQPGALAQKTRLAAVSVEEAWVDGARQPVVARTELKLPLDVKRLEFHFVSPEFETPGRLRFRYRLQGFDDGWVDAGAQRVAYYGHLPAGEYQFRVMAGVDGNWREADQPLPVRVVPRFWDTRWFQISGLVFVVALVAGAVRYAERAKLRRRLERLEMQQAMEKERRRIAQDLHDDLGSGITEIMLLGELAKQEAAASSASTSQIATITEKVRHLASAMDEVVWTVNPKNDSLANLASYLCDFAREFFRASAVRCRIDRMEGLPAATLTAHARHNLFLAVKEALNNVAKHSGASEVWLRIQHEAGRLTICVEDDGKGFDLVAPKDPGNGLQNMRARLNAIGGMTEISSKLEGGTCVKFQVTLPSPSLN